MDAAAGQEQEVGKAKYRSPWWTQVWFLEKSRRKWKEKYQQLKAKVKEWQYRVRDLTKSREKWRVEAEQHRQRLAELEAANAALRAALETEGAAVEKKVPRRAPAVSRNC